MNHLSVLRWLACSLLAICANAVSDPEPANSNAGLERAIVGVKVDRNGASYIINPEMAKYLILASSSNGTNAGHALSSSYYVNVTALQGNSATATNTTVPLPLLYKIGYFNGLPANRIMPETLQEEASIKTQTDEPQERTLAPGTEEYYDYEEEEEEEEEDSETGTSTVSERINMETTTVAEVTPSSATQAETTPTTASTNAETMSTTEKKRPNEPGNLNLAALLAQVGQELTSSLLQSSIQNKDSNSPLGFITQLFGGGNPPKTVPKFPQRLDASHSDPQMNIYSLFNPHQRVKPVKVEEDVNGGPPPMRTKPAWSALDSVVLPSRNQVTPPTLVYSSPAPPPGFVTPQEDSDIVTAPNLWQIFVSSSLKDESHASASRKDAGRHGYVVDAGEVIMGDGESGTDEKGQQIEWGLPSLPPAPSRLGLYSEPQAQMTSADLSVASSFSVNSNVDHGASVNVAQSRQKLDNHPERTSLNDGKGYRKDGLFLAESFESEGTFSSTESYPTWDTMNARLAWNNQQEAVKRGMKPDGVSSVPAPFANVPIVTSPALNARVPAQEERHTAEAISLANLALSHRNHVIAPVLTSENAVKVVNTNSNSNEGTQQVASPSQQEDDQEYENEEHVDQSEEEDEDGKKTELQYNEEFYRDLWRNRDFAQSRQRNAEEETWVDEESDNTDEESQENTGDSEEDGKVDEPLNKGETVELPEGRKNESEDSREDVTIEESPESRKITELRPQKTAEVLRQRANKEESRPKEKAEDYTKSAESEGTAQQSKHEELTLKTEIEESSKIVAHHENEEDEDDEDSADSEEKDENAEAKADSSFDLLPAFLMKVPTTAPPSRSGVPSFFGLSALQYLNVEDVEDHVPSVESTTSVVTTISSTVPPTTTAPPSPTIPITTPVEATTASVTVSEPPKVISNRKGEFEEVDHFEDVDVTAEAERSQEEDIVPLNDLKTELPPAITTFPRFVPSSVTVHTESTPPPVVVVIEEDTDIAAAAWTLESLAYITVGILTALGLVIFCLGGVYLRCKHQPARWIARIFREADTFSNISSAPPTPAPAGHHRTRSMSSNFGIPEGTDIGGGVTADLEAAFGQKKLGSWLTGRHTLPLNLTGVTGEMKENQIAVTPRSLRSEHALPMKAYFTDGQYGSTRDLVSLGASSRRTSWLHHSFREASSHEFAQQQVEQIYGEKPADEETEVVMVIEDERERPRSSTTTLRSPHYKYSNSEDEDDEDVEEGERQLQITGQKGSRRGSVAGSHVSLRSHGTVSHLDAPDGDRLI